jgi:hypothetical protein
MFYKPYPHVVTITTPIDHQGLFTWLSDKEYNWMYDKEREVAHFSFKEIDDATLFKLMWV